MRARGRIRTDMSEVNIQASASSSRTTPATTSIMKAITLARSAPWCNNSARGLQLQAEFSVTHLGHHAEAGRNGIVVVE